MSAPPPNSVPTCRHCGAPLPAQTGAASDACPACLLDLALTLESTSEVDPTQFDRYRILTRPDGSPYELGRGTMGVTYKAFDERLQIEIALKVIKSNWLGNPTVQGLFLREARAAARVRHPNVASVLFLNDEPEHFFYAMEFVAGQSLGAWLTERGPIKPELATDLSIQLARGLGAIHDQKIVHRDLKPSNVMVFPVRPGCDGHEPESWQLKIIDFGLARVLDATMDDRQIVTQGFKGTAIFASPEQCAEDPDIDGRADLYCLGCLIWQMVTGAPPFAGRTQRETLNLHLAGKLPEEKIARLPAGLRNVLRRLLEKKREDRFQNAADVEKALEQSRDPSVGDAPARPAAGARMSLPHAGSLDDRGRWLAIGLGVALVAAGLVWYSAQSARKPGDPRATPTATPATTATASTAEKSIAVLPFQNLSAEPDNAFFASGVQDELLTKLARISQLKVISRESVRQYKDGDGRNLREIGAALGVGYVLEGSVQRFGPRVRVTAQLIDATADAHVWAEHFDRDVSDLLGIQTEIAEAIAAQLRIRLTPAEKFALDQPATSDTRAYELYLHAKDLVFSGSSGRSVMGKREIESATRLLNEAVVRDPNFFAAYLLLAFCHDNYYWYGNDKTPARLELAQSALDQAQRIRPGAAELHLAKARHLYWGYLAYERANLEIAKARELLPNDPAVLYLQALIDRRQGRVEGAIRNLERVTELSPNEVTAAYDLAECYSVLRRAKPFFRVMDRLVLQNPRDPELRVFRATSGNLAMLDDPQPLQEVLNELERTDPATFREFALDSFFLALVTRDSERARRAVALISDDWSMWNRRNYPREYFAGSLEYFLGDRNKSGAPLAAAREAIIGRPEGVEKLDREWMALAEIDAMLGRREDAVREAQRALALWPLSRDSWDGAGYLEGLAGVHAILQDADPALQELEEAVDLPNALDLGWLRQPKWDPIRQDPRFAKIKARLAPRD